MFDAAEFRIAAASFGETRRRDSRNHVLQLLERPNLHDVARWLGFEDYLFLREGIDALAFLRRGLVLHDDLAQTGNRERLRAAAADGLLDLIIQRVEHVADISLRQA